MIFDAEGGSSIRTALVRVGVVGETVLSDMVGKQLVNRLSLESDINLDIRSIAVSSCAERNMA